MNKTFLLCLSLGAAANALAQASRDIQATPTKSTYLQDSRGVIARSPYGLCWRTGTWTPADAVAGCDGELAPPIAKPTAPAIAVPATTPMPAAAIAPKRCDFSVTLGSDQAFLFNKAVLNEAAKKQIDNEFLPRLSNCAKVDLIMVTGHTDRLGSQQYNQKLSEKRANAVATYLKSKGATGETDTMGAGKTQPIQSCPDNLPRPPLIACLAPNRRVTIEVRGTGQ